ncbi:MAG: hypothetical protein GTO41_08195 [Burkholderiales bacterium]|nr:hypothetical protein [Burkholderiales bacterium]
MTARLTLLILILSALHAPGVALANDEALGRLFYTARQRASLDANIRVITRKVEEPTPIPPSVILNGIVTRSDGERTVWIDGRAYHRTDTGDFEVMTRPTDPGAAEIKVQGVPRRQPVRVGQRLDPASGETFESFETSQPATRLEAPGQNADGSDHAQPALSEQRD